MPMEDGFDPDYPLPLFLADRAERQGIQKDCDRAVISSRVFKASILIAAATAAGIVVLSVGGPVSLFAAVRASLVGNSGLQPGTHQPESTIQSTADAPAAIQSTADVPAAIQPAADASALVQSTADAQVLPPTTKGAPPRDEIAASEPAGEDQAEQSKPSSEVLFRQFQAWAAGQDAQANVRPAQPVQDAPAKVVQDAPAQVAENASVPHRFMQKHRHVLPAHNARAETRTQNFQKDPPGAKRAGRTSADAECAGTSADTRCPSTEPGYAKCSRSGCAKCSGPGRAKCSRTVVPANLRSAQLTHDPDPRSRIDREVAHKRKGVCAGRSCANKVMRDDGSS